jgi:hypothetical protein
MSELQQQQKPRQEIWPTHKNHETYIWFNFVFKRFKVNETFFLMANKYVKIY